MHSLPFHIGHYSFPLVGVSGCRGRHRWASDSVPHADREELHIWPYIKNCGSSDKQTARVRPYAFAFGTFTATGLQTRTDENEDCAYRSSIAFTELLRSAVCVA